MKVRLGDICEILNGYAFKSSDYTKDGIRIIRISNVQKGFIEDSSPVFYPKDNKYAQNYALIENDLLISLTGNVGRVALISRDLLPAALNQRVACIRIKDKHTILTKYLFHLLNSDIFEHDCIISAQGIAQKNMSTSWLQQYEISIDPLETQSKRINVLDTLDSLISRRKRQLLKLDQLVKSRFMEMFGDVVHNSRKWPISRLSELGYLNRGVSKTRPRNLPELFSGKYPLIQTGDVAHSDTFIKNFSQTYSDIGLAQSKLWPKGTLCITIAANIAKASILQFDACFPDSVVGFIPKNKATIMYVLYCLKSLQKILESQAPQVAQKNINLKILNDLTIPLPPLPLQQQFAAFVEKVDKSKLAVKQSLEKLETLKKSLMQQYFG